MHDTKERLSLLWIFALLNYLYADVLALFAFVGSPNSAPHLPQWPQIRDVEAQVGIRMKDFGPGKPLCSETSQVLPRHPAFLAATLQYPQPAFAHFTPKALETGEVSGNGMIVGVALYHAPQPFPDFRQRMMHALPKLVLHLFQLGKESLSDTLAQHEELAVLPSLPTDVGEAQKVERLRLALPMLLPT